MFIYESNKDPVKARIEFDIALHRVEGNLSQGAFYFDTGRGFNEREILKFNYYQSVDGQFAHYSLRLPSQAIERLRFDPLPAAGVVTIKNIILTRYFPKKMVFSDQNNDVVPLHAIQKIEKNGPECLIVANSDDPYLVFTNGNTEVSIFDIDDIMNYMGIDKFLSGIAAWLLLSTLITSFCVSDIPSSQDPV